jgi:hypothetical protein
MLIWKLICLVWIAGTATAVLIPDLVCVQIASSISPASDVYYPGEVLYDKGIYHWASSSTQLAKCVVEPGTTADVAVIVRYGFVLPLEYTDAF